MLLQPTMPMHMKLVSNRDDCYHSLAPMMLGIGFGWIMVAGGVTAGCLALAHNEYFAASLIVPALIFALYLVFSTYNVIRQSNCDYIIEISDHDAAYSTIDHWQKTKTNRSILLTDIKYAEYYPYLDSASIIFHTSYSDLEMPLWPMGKHARDIVDFLVGTGVKIVDVQSDDVIPE